MADKLKMDALNALPHPLLARFIGGDVWPVLDICVETGLMRIDVCGMADRHHFVDVAVIIDGDGGEHAAEQFWHD